MRKTAPILAVIGSLLSTAGFISVANGADAIPAYVKAAVADPGRPPGDISQDLLRRPDEVLAFAGLKPGMVVAELFPRGTYYTRILSQLVGSKGKVYAVSPMRAGYRDLDALNKEREQLMAAGKPAPPDPFGATVALQDITEYSNVVPMLEMFWQYNGQFSVPEQLDAVWAVDGFHDFYAPDQAGVVSGSVTTVGPDGTPRAAWKTKPDVFGVAKMMDSVNKEIFASLTPGGIYLVADYADLPDPSFSRTYTSHRTDGETIKAGLIAAGFVFAGESKALNFPDDDRSRSTDDRSFQGKIDQYLMIFKKPINAPKNKRPSKNALAGYYGNTVVMYPGTAGTPSQQERHIFYHADGNYQEFGPSRTPMQAGLWYWDAAGHNCLLPQSPTNLRDFLDCQSTAPYKKVGDNWTQEPAGGGDGPPIPFTMIKGYDPVVK